MDHAAAFRAWVLDPARTSDELHLAELLIEEAESLAPFDDARANERWQKSRRARRRKRALDPAYRPPLSRARLDAALARWPELRALNNTWGEERPVRDLGALRFTPGLVELDLETQLRDLSPLAVLPELTHLRLSDTRLTDITVLRRLPRLQKLDLWFGHPWPDPAGLEALTACRNLSLTLSAFHLEAVPVLPLLEELTLKAYRHLPLRDFHRMPEMPALRKLDLEATGLAGIERYPSLEVVKLTGRFEDLSPLAGLPRLRELTLHGEIFEDLSPLARLPELRQLTLERERGLLLDPLLEAPRLRRVLAPHNRVLATELVSLNAAIGWSHEDFFLETPRPLAPLRVLTYKPGHPELAAVKALPRPPDPRLAVPGHDATFEEAEQECMERALRAQLDAAYQPGWGRLFICGHAIHVDVHRDWVRMRALDVLEALRVVLARARHRWRVYVSFAEDDEPDETDDEKEEDFRHHTPEDIENYRRRVRDERLRLEREHQLRLRNQGLVSSPPAGDIPPDPEDEAMPDDDDEPEDPAPPGSPLAELLVTLNEHHVWVPSHYVDAARAVLRVEPEDWHALPEPPEQRPRPQ